jgi:hypothetical protein
MLLAAAALLLQRHGYRTEPVALPDGRTLLLAEDDYFIVGLADFSDPQDLIAAEASASESLVDRLADLDSAAKRWDVYLVLLSPSAKSGEALSETITTIVYNTRFLRRIVRWDLTPDVHVLTRALQPFLPLPAPPRDRPAAPTELLVERLAQFGIAADEARLAVAQWREASQA